MSMIGSDAFESEAVVMIADCYLHFMMVVSANATCNLPEKKEVGVRSRTCHTMSRLPGMPSMRLLLPEELNDPWSHYPS
jgi:hypothetical protein